MPGEMLERAKQSDELRVMRTRNGRSKTTVLKWSDRDRMESVCSGTENSQDVDRMSPQMMPAVWRGQLSTTSFPAGMNTRGKSSQSMWWMDPREPCWCIIAVLADLSASLLGDSGLFGFLNVSLSLLRTLNGLGYSVFSVEWIGSDWSG